MLLLAFVSSNLFVFYIAFEGLTIPTFYLIFIYGSEITKLKAAKHFLVYSFLSSFFLIITIGVLHNSYNTTNILEIQILMNKGYDITNERFTLLFLSMFLGFGIKIPLAPFHMWLPEAHAEASTPGSLILAGLILKLGGYGYFKFLLPFYFGYSNHNPLIFIFCTVSAIVALLACFKVTHLKQIIAYTSILHMSFSTLGILSGKSIGVTGGLLSMFSHSLISSGLFLCGGILYARYGTYELQALTLIKKKMPNFSFYFILCS